MTAKKPTAAQPAKAKADEEAQAKAAAEAQAKADAEAQAKADAEAKYDQVTPDFLEVKTRKGVPSFRRAGLAFTQQPTRIPLADLSEDQIAALMNEDRLTVTPIIDKEGAE
jgi:membrane protein involved in colicin uptake